MIRRATLIVTGAVQKVAYRYRIARLAFDSDLRGFARNLESGEVEIVCEGESGEIEKFARSIRFRDFPVRVDGVDVRFSEPTGEFNDFELVRDTRSNGDALDKMDSGFDYIQLMHNDLSKKLELVMGAITAMDAHMGERFEHLDIKYDTFGVSLNSFGAKLDRISDDIRAMRELMARLVEHLIEKDGAEA